MPYPIRRVTSGPASQSFVAMMPQFIVGTFSIRLKGLGYHVFDLYSYYMLANIVRDNYKEVLFMRNQNIFNVKV